MGNVWVQVSVWVGLVFISALSAVWFKLWSSLAQTGTSSVARYGDRDRRAAHDGCEPMVLLRHLSFEPHQDKSATAVTQMRAVNGG